MRSRLLGHPGLRVSELALGTMSWGGRGFWGVIGKLGLDAARDQLRLAFDRGVNLVDTADVYGEGTAEEMLGQAIRDLGLPREDLVIATKARGQMGPGPNGARLTRVRLMYAVDASLRRLGLDDIDLHQLPGVGPHTPLAETIDALDAIVRSGKVRYVGPTNFPAWQIVTAQARAGSRGQARPHSIQV